MTEAEIREQIPGAAEFIDWFGHWPSFHDAEVLRCDLRRVAGSEIVIHAWRMSDKLDERGYYVLEKHVLVTFVLGEVEQLEMRWFNHGNVLYDLELKHVDGMFTLLLNPTYGLEGLIASKQLSLRWKPGKPDESVYA